MSIWFAFNITFINLRFENITGSSAQITLMKSYLSISNSSFLNTVSKEYFFQLMFSECDFYHNIAFNVISSFFYGSSCAISIIDNKFLSSFDWGSVMLSMIFFSGLNNFLISNNNFDDLHNYLQGPVYFFYFYSYILITFYFFFKKRQYI